MSETAGNPMYRIAVDIIARDTNAASPFEEIARLLRNIREEAQETREAISNVSGSFQDAVRHATVLRDIMESVRQSARGTEESMRRGFTENPRYSRSGNSDSGGSSSASSEPRRYPTSFPAPLVENMDPPGWGRRVAPHVYDAEPELRVPRRPLLERPIIDAEFTDVPGPMSFPARATRHPASGGSGIGGGPPPFSQANNGGPSGGSGGGAGGGNGGGNGGGGNGGGNGGGGNGGGGSHSSHTVFTASDIYYGLKSTLGAAAAPAFNEEQQIAVLRARLGYDGAEIARRAARSGQTGFAGTNLADNYALFNTLLSVTQDPREASVFMRTALPFGTALAQVNPKGGNYEQQLENSVRSAEFLGLTSRRNARGELEFDESATKRILGMSVSLANVTRGQFGPEQLIRFLRSAGSAGAEMDPESIMTMFPIIQTLGPQGAGTALRGFNQQFAAGRQSQAAVDLLIRAGIIRGGGNAKSNPYIIPRGIGEYQVLPQGMDKGAAHNVMEHPAAFIHDYLLPHIDQEIKRTERRDVTQMSPRERMEYETNYLQLHASRIPGGNFMSEITRAYLQVQRDVAALQTLPTNQVDMLNQAPLVKTEAFSGALTHFVAILGGDAVPLAVAGLTGITAAIDKFNHAADSGAGGVVARVTGGGLGVGATVLGAGLGLRGAGSVARLFGMARLGAAGLGAGALVSELAIPAAIAAGAGFTAYEGAEYLGRHYKGVNDFYKSVPGLGWLATNPPSTSKPLPVQIIGSVHVGNTGDIARGATDYAAGQIADPHAQSPHDHHLSTPASPARHH